MIVICYGFGKDLVQLVILVIVIVMVLEWILQISYCKSCNEFFYVTGFGKCEHCNAFGSFMQLGNCNEICKLIEW